MRKIFLAILFMSTQLTTHSQQRIFLYPSAEEVMHKGYDTIAPFIDYYPSSNPSGHKTAVIICPGGAYTNLAWDKEGILVSRFFNNNGIDAFVLKYRLNNGNQEGHRYPAQYNDLTTAIRIVRSRAAEWHIDPDKTGVMGFSAGGHLASTAATILQKANPDAANPLERLSSRPSFAILIYPVITMDTIYAHRYSREMLLGKTPDEALVTALSTEKRVTADTPPIFLVHADDDRAVPPQNSILFYEALKKYNVPASMFIYDHGGHGFGMAPTDSVLNQWPALCVQWLQRQGFR